MNASRLIPTFMILTAVGLPVQCQQAEFRTLASGLAGDIQASGKKTIAVVDFTDLQGNPTELGRYLAEELSVAMARTHKGFEVIDRAHLKALLAEHRLAASGLIDPATAKKLGQISGADVLLTGTMTPFSESVRVAVKALATDTARILAADTADLPKTTTISELLANNIGAGSSRSNAAPSRSGPVSSESTPSNLPTSSPVMASQEFLFEVVECKGVANSVRCSLRITNKSSDREMFQFCNNSGKAFEGTSRAFDDSGNGAGAQDCSIANVHGNGNIIAHVVSGVTVGASVLFNNLSTSATRLSLITIMGTCRIPGQMSSNYSVSFRNVPIVR
jgi:TolB-like protein